MSVNFFKNGTLTKIARGLKDAAVTITNNLLATKPGTALDAVQGKVLDDKITEVNNSLANANNYSADEETIIGKWIDGKPIYRKIIKINNLSKSKVEINIDLDINDVDCFVRFDGYLKRYIDNSLFYGIYSLNSTEQSDIFAWSRVTFNNEIYKFTYKLQDVNDKVWDAILYLEYTKTTD